MKTILADDEVLDTARTGFPVQIEAVAAVMKRLLGRCLARRIPPPWNQGYDAFYDITAINPYAENSAPALEWEQGRNAASADFEW